MRKPKPPRYVEIPACPIRHMGKLNNIRHVIENAWRKQGYRTPVYVTISREPIEGAVELPSEVSEVIEKEITV